MNTDIRDELDLILEEFRLSCKLGFEEHFEKYKKIAIDQIVNLFPTSKSYKEDFMKKNQDELREAMKGDGV